MKLDWHFGPGLVDWNWIGRVALNRQIGDGLISNWQIGNGFVLNWQIGNELADESCICIGWVDWTRICIGWEDWWLIGRLVLRAVHILCQPILGVSRPPGPPLVILRHLLAYPPSPLRHPSSAFARPPFTYKMLWQTLFNMTRWGIFICFFYLYTYFMAWL